MLLFDALMALNFIVEILKINLEKVIEMLCDNPRQKECCFTRVPSTTSGYPTAMLFMHKIRFWCSARDTVQTAIGEKEQH